MPTMDHRLQILSLLFLLFQFATAKSGYLLTSPKAFFSINTETVYLTLFDVPDTGNFKISLTTPDGNETKILHEVSQNVDKPSPSSGQVFKVNLEVPKLSHYTRVTLKVDGSLGSYSFSNQTDLTAHTRSDSTFVQTDKPIYKPGQLVRFRILPVDFHLRPLSNKVKADVWVENPSGVRLAQWLDQSFETGMSQYDMQLAEKPELGQWSIYVNLTTLLSKESQIKTEYFRVEEYVLPKFEVIVTPPPFVLSSAENVTWKICGRYTYGKLVKGNLSLVASFEGYGSWDRNVYPKIRHEEQIDGCTNYTVHEKDIRWLNVSYRYRPLKLFAQITEDGTEVEQNGTATVSLTTNPVQLSFTYPEYDKRFFKPGMPFVGELSVTNPDNTPKADEKIQICAMATTEELSAFHHSTDTNLFCKNFTSDEKGRVRFTVPPKSGNFVSLKIQADAVDHPTQKYSDNVVMIYQPSNNIQLTPWYSNAKRYIQILPVVKTIPCGTSQEFTIFLNGEDQDTITLHSQVMSRDGIVSDQSTTYEYSKIKDNLPVDETYIANTLETENTPENPTVLGIVTVTVEAAYDMAPKGYLVVYYTTPDGEVIADSVEFEISKCLKNKVGMDFLSAKELPGTKVGIKVTASPKSLCGIGAVDKSIYLLGSSNALTVDKVFDLLSNYDSTRYGYSYYPSSCVPQKTPSLSTFVRRKRSFVVPPYRISSRYADSLSAFQNGNFLVLSDLTLVTKPCPSVSSPGPIRPYYSGLVFTHPPVRRRGRMRSNFRTTTDYEEFESDGLTLAEEVRTTVPVPLSSPARPLPMSTRPVSSYGGANKIGAAAAIPESAADIALSGPPGMGSGFAGGFKPVVEVRNFFPETWLWEVESTDENGEFIIKRELPHTITEWIGSTVCLHSEDGIGVSPSANVTAFQPFFVSATLPYSVIRGEILPVIITVFNYLKECLPITLRLDESKDFELVNGNLEQTFCVCGGNSFTHKYLVKPSALGQVNFTSHAFTSQSNNVCGNNIVGNVTARDGSTNSLLVEPEGFKRQESFSSFFCPSNTNGTFKTTYELVTPENYVADSARAEFLVTGDLMGPALRNIDNLVQMPTGCGEQNMLHFVPDIFILDYLTNTGKLTAETEKKLLEYLKIGYQRELTYRHGDGSYSAFGESDPVGSIWLSAFVVKAYQGASKYIFVDKSDISRTAQWINAHQDDQGCFPEVGEVHHTAMKGGSGSNLGSKATLTSYILISLLEAQLAKNSTSVERALSCLEQEKNPTTYTLALMTYASCLAKDPSANQKLETLMSLKKTKGAGDYWEDDSTHSAAIQIETASYAILSLLTCGGEDSMEKALPIVRWISQRRNANGGFISTQDTVMALQALARYATNIDIKSAINIDVSMEAQELGKVPFHVDESNKLLVQVTKLPEIPTPVVVEATGTGCSLVQANLFYNILTPPGFQAFQYNMSTLRGVGGSCKKAEITACMSYNYEDRFSNMVVLELRLPSGYEADKESLDLLKRDQTLYFKRSDIDGNNLALYFSKVGPTKKCFSFRLDQTFEVQNLQPSTAKLFDYYQPENQISQSFTIDEECP